MNRLKLKWNRYLIFIFTILAVIPLYTEKTWSLTGEEPKENHQKVSDPNEGINFIRDVKVLLSGGKTAIVVTSDRALDAETLIIEDKKFVIDVKNANYSVLSQDMPVENSKLISKIRIGKSDPPEHKVRIVADLKEQITYNVNKGERT
ncbi:MAG: AMIN domain-containing protein [Nitrospira sp.]|nr:AMIN domain-containing protein [Nitrospira sp.]